MTDDRELTAMNVRGHQRRHKHDQYEREQQPAVMLDHNAEFREMAADRPEHHAAGQQRPRLRRARIQQPGCGNQFGNATGVTPHGSIPTLEKM